MLMYRQIDPHRNVSSLKREHFPEHIRVSKKKEKKKFNFENLIQITNVHF